MEPNLVIVFLIFMVPLAVFFVWILFRRIAAFELEASQAAARAEAAAAPAPAAAPAA